MTGPTKIQVELTPNDDEVIVSWRVQGRPVDRIWVNASDLEDCTDRIRKSLNDLNIYVKNNILLSNELDIDFKRYNEILNKLRRHGSDLHNLILPKSTSLEKRTIERFIEALPVNSLLDVYVEDQNVTIPLGFAFDGRPMQPGASPSLQDFAGFWLSKFHITTWLGGVFFAPEPLPVEAGNFRALYAVDRHEWDDAWDELLKTFPDFAPVFQLPCGIHDSWDDAEEVWKTMANFDSLFFLFGHSDGRNVVISGEERPGYHVKNYFSKSGSRTSSIIVANACMSLAGNRSGGSSILSLATQGGFTGIIGTEAEILNTKALSCGARLIHGLCIEGLSFGDAFDRMRSDPRLFPLNLFYSCYGDRNFRLDKPVCDGAVGNEQSNHTN
jgi:hypothetical protein